MGGWGGWEEVRGKGQPRWGPEGHYVENRVWVTGTLAEFGAEEGTLGHHLKGCLGLDGLSLTLGTHKQNQESP